jgi:lipopolysaccharide transport system ATP-binding protein
MPSTLECRDVSKSFLLQDLTSAWRILFGLGGGKRFKALDDVTIDVPKGQFVGILGKNGAGKSTLLRTIGGVYTPDSGIVVVNGDMSALYELGITGNEHLTGRGFANRWFDVYSSRTEKRRDLIADVHDFSELEEAFDRPIRTYSAGMKARLFFALATARKSKIYVIDEVLSVGDEYFQNKCWRRIRQRLSGGASGIIATHDWSAILRLCPKSYIIEKGRMIAHGASPGVVKKYLGLSTDSFGNGARFDPMPPQILTGRSLEDFQVDVDIHAAEKCSLVFGAAVEVFEAGFGWEHVLHADNRPIGIGPGRIKVRLSIPRLPLKGGDYSLAIFLSKTDPVTGKLVPLDVRSWTYNEGLTLRVDGEESQGAIRWPISLARPEPPLLEGPPVEMTMEGVLH